MPKRLNELPADPALNLNRLINVADPVTGKLFKITATQLKNVLQLSVNTSYAGPADVSTNPGTPSGAVFYTAGGAGTYTNFLDATSTPIVVGPSDGLVIFSYSGGHWVKQITPFDLSNYYNIPSADAKFVAPDIAGNMLSVKIPDTQWQHARGDSEISGNAVATFDYSAIYELIPTKAIVSGLTLPYYCVGFDTTATIRIYKSSSFNANPASLTLLEEITIAAGKFNNINTNNFDVTFASDYLVNNEYLYAFVVWTSGAKIYLKYWNADTTSPARHRFYTGTGTNTWTTAWTASTGAFYAATFKVRYISATRRLADGLNTNALQLDGNGNIYGGAPPTIQWQHSRGQTETLGNSTYTPVSTTSLGVYDTITNRALFNTFEIAMWAGADSVVIVRFYKCVPPLATNVINNLTLLEEVTFAAGTFNRTANTLASITLANKYQIELGWNIVALFQVTAGTALTISRFTALFGSSPERHTFLTSTSSTPFAAGTSWAFSSTGFYQTAFNLKYVSPNVKNVDDRLKVVEGSAAMVNSSNQLLGVVVPETQWQHARGDAEVLGSSVFTNYGVGQYEQITSKVVFNHLQIGFYAGADSVIRVRLYKNSSYTNNLAAFTLLDEITYTAGVFNQDSSKAADVYTNSNISIAANEFLFVFAFTDSGTQVKTKYWNADTTNPARHRFLYFTSTPVNWATTWQVSSGAFYQATFKLLLTNLQLQQSFNSLQTLAIPDPRIILPSKIYAVSGFQLNIYYDAIILANERGSDALSGVTVTVDCAVGYGYQEYYQLNATSGQAGTYTFTVKVYDYAKNLIESKACSLIVVAAAAIGSAKNILRVGDSLTQPQSTTQAIQNNLASVGGTTPIFYGTVGSDPYKREGRGGWKFSDYTGVGPTYYRFDVSGVTSAVVGATYTHNSSTYSIVEVNITSGTGYINTTRTAGTNNPLSSGTLTKASGSGDSTLTFSSTSTVSGNPFWNAGTSQLDIANYRTTILGMAGGTKFDLVDIQLGINDLGQNPTSVISDASITTIISNIKLLIDAFIADNPSCKIIIQLSPTCNSTGGAFNRGDYRTFYLLNHWKLRQSIITAIDNGAYNANASVGYSGAYMHRFYGYPSEQRTLSARYTGVTKENNTNNVHPRTEGYLELGDGIFHQVYYLLTN